MNAKELGRQVKKRRNELGISQEALADQAEISRNYLSLIERGEARNVSTGVLSRIATALGAAPAELTGEAGEGETLIPSALREFARAEGLSFSVADWLVRMPRRGKEPQNVDEWRKLYNSVRPFLDSDI
jgi:transcriptional regulator with XRE-family HTH domain